MLHYVRDFLFCLPFTLAIETIIIFLLIRKWFRIDSQQLSTKLIIFVGVCASALTLPYVWFVFPYVILSSLAIAIAAGEIFAFILEAFFYKAVLKISFKEAFIISLAANIASFLFSLVLRQALIH